MTPDPQEVTIEPAQLFAQTGRTRHAAATRESFAWSCRTFEARTRVSAAATVLQMADGSRSAGTASASGLSANGHRDN